MYMDRPTVREMVLDAQLRERKEKIEADLAAVRAERDALLVERERLRGALSLVNKTLTVPAAEYVPAITDAWKIIEDALNAR